MANPTIRGHRAQFKMYKDGKEIVIDTIKRVSIGQDSSFTKNFYIGKSIPEGDQTFEGWSGSLELDCRTSEVEDFIDGLVTDNLNGVGISDYSFVTNESYSDGSRRSYVYVDSQWKMSREQGSMQEKMVKRLEFQAMTRIRI